MSDNDSSLVRSGGKSLRRTRETAILQLASLVAVLVWSTPYSPSTRRSSRLRPLGRSFWEGHEVAKEIYAYVFSGNGRSTAVLSSTPQAGEYAIPDAEGVAALDLFGNPLPPGSTFSGTLVYLSTEEGVEFVEKLLGIAPAGNHEERLNPPSFGPVGVVANP